MITSPDNQKLKLARKLADRSWRQKESLFVSEGEDLLGAGLTAGVEPAFVLVAPGSGIEGEEVEPELLDACSGLGSGTRVIAVWPIPAADPVLTAPCVYLHGVGDPGNAGAIIRSAHALGAGSVLCGPGTADPWSPRAVRATMGSIFAIPVGRGGVELTPEPRLAMVAAGGELPGSLARSALATLCLGAEREGLPPEVLEACEQSVTIPIADGADSLNVAAAAAIALERISSAAVEAPGDRADG